MQAAPPSISTSGEDAITRTLDVQPDTTIVGPIDEAYDIEWTASLIEKHNYSRIALQLPDELLHASVAIFRSLKRKISGDRQLYVLADTTYGSCCVDEVAAQHVDADVVVHYGHACLSPTSRLPVIYVFGRKPVDVSHCAESLVRESHIATKSPRAVLLLYDVPYEHQADAISAALKDLVPPSTNVIANRISRTAAPGGGPLADPSDSASTSTQSENIDRSAGRRYQLAPDVPVADCLIFYVGGEGLALTNILMTHGTNEVWSYDPVGRASRLESVKTNRMLMRRYAIMQKARDADVFGILIGTLGVAQYLPMIKHVRELLTRAQKKTYTISVGKLNPSKLANFMEIECYVLVACPENSLIDSKEFLRPIITPFELEIALGGHHQWTGRYVLDFEKVLSEAEHGGTTPVDDHDGGPDGDDPDGPTFSLTTGKYRQAKRYGKPAQDVPGETSALTVRNQETTVAKFMDSAGGEFLQSRSFKGLESRVGLDAPSTLEQGRSGIARGYGETDES